VDVAEIIRQYGYLAVFVGAFLEGETVLVMAGFAAYQGYVEIEWVILIALSAGFLGDQTFFYIGRRYGEVLLRRFPSLRARAHRVDQLLLRYHWLLIPGIRFMYGLRIPGPIIFGMGRVGVLRFMGLNLLGAAIWAPLIAGAGYLFGKALQLLLDDLKRYEMLGLALIVLFFVGAWLWHRRKRSRIED
jgi:membrane protein DedA with SNARE-associated domain